MKSKIINDPVYGFLRFPNALVFSLIEHPYFQRLRHIKQMGLAYYVYPGAVHTRFQHSLGACHLMGEAMRVLRVKGHDIDDDTLEAAQIAILLHDIGHGPFSHTLEHTLIKGTSHEDISLILMNALNEAFDGRLEQAISIFTKRSPEKYISQLVSGQLDMDRMDYLNRDSFFSGVSEGVIGYDRILEMLDIHDQQLVVEEKGLQSVEKFLIARRMMYWQVYLHKTVLSAELLMTKILKRAKDLASAGQQIHTTLQLSHFLYNEIDKTAFYTEKEHLHRFIELGDDDITASVKMWAHHTDKVLSELCRMFLNRQLYKIKISDEDFSEKYEFYKTALLKDGSIDEADLDYYLIKGETENNTYNSNERIDILTKSGKVKDITHIEHTLITPDISQPVKRNYLAVRRDVLEKTGKMHL